MQKFKHEIRWAFLFSITTLIWMLLEKGAGLHDKYIEYHPMVTNLFAIPAIAVYVFALRLKKKSYYSGDITYKQGFISGALMTLFVSLLAPITQYITSVYITPEYFPNVISYAVKSGEMTQAEAEEYFNLKSYMIQTIIATPIMGLVTTAIVMIFLRKK